MNTQSILDHHSGCKAKPDKEHTKQEGQENVKKSQEKIQVPGMRGDILVTQLWGHQGITKSRMPLNIFCLVQPEDLSHFTSWIFLDHPSWVVWVSPHSVRQTVISFFSHIVYNVMVLMLTILSYVSFALMFQLQHVKTKNIQ